MGSLPPAPISPGRQQNKKLITRSLLFTNAEKDKILQWISPKQLPSCIEASFLAFAPQHPHGVPEEALTDDENDNFNDSDNDTAPDHVYVDALAHDPDQEDDHNYVGFPDEENIAGENMMMNGHNNNNNEARV